MLLAALFALSMVSAAPSGTRALTPRSYAAVRASDSRIRYVRLRMREFHADGKAFGWETLTVDLRTGRLADIVRDTEHNPSVGFDGSRGWQTDTFGTGFLDRGQQRADDILESRTFSGVADRIPRVLSVGSGGRAYRVRWPDDGRAVHYTFDRDGNLATVVPEHAGYRFEFKKYTESAGVVYPQYIRTCASSGCIINSDVRLELLPTVAASVFAQPAGPNCGLDVNQIARLFVFVTREGSAFTIARVNGRAAFFQIDSGDGATYLSESFAHALGLRLGSPRSLAVFGGKAQGRRARVTSLQLGSIRFRNLPVLVTRDDEDDIDGAIGYDLLARFAVRFDLERGGLLVARRADLLRPRGRRLAIDVDGTASTAIRIEGRRVDATIDTGLESGVSVNGKAVRRLHLAMRGRQKIFVGAGGSERLREGLEDNVRVGATPFSAVPMVMQSPTSRLADDDVSIGAQLLRRTIFTLDYRQGVMWLEPRAADRPAHARR